MVCISFSCFLANIYFKNVTISDLHSMVQKCTIMEIYTKFKYSNNFYGFLQYTKTHEDRLRIICCHFSSCG